MDVQKGFFPGAYGQELQTEVDHSKHAVLMVGDSILLWAADNVEKARSHGSFGNAMTWSADYLSHYAGFNAAYCQAIAKKGATLCGDSVVKDSYSLASLVEKGLNEFLASQVERLKNNNGAESPVTVVLLWYFNELFIGSHKYIVQPRAVQEEILKALRIHVTNVLKLVPQYVIMLGAGATAFGDGGEHYNAFRDECINTAREAGVIVVSSELMMFYLKRSDDWHPNATQDNIKRFLTHLPIYWVFLL